MQSITNYQTNSSLLVIFIMADKYKTPMTPLNSLPIPLLPKSSKMKERTTSELFTKKLFLHQPIRLKEYSNKFLRENNFEDHQSQSKSLHRTKQSVMFVRMKNNIKKNKENMSIKAETKNILHDHRRTTSSHNNFINQVQRISASRALEYFAKLHKKNTSTNLKLKRIYLKTQIEAVPITLKQKMRNNAHSLKARSMKGRLYKARQTQYVQNQEEYQIAGWDTSFT